MLLQQEDANLCQADTQSCAQYSQHAPQKDPLRVSGINIPPTNSSERLFLLCFELVEMMASLGINCCYALFCADSSVGMQQNCTSRRSHLALVRALTLYISLKHR